MIAVLAREAGPLSMEVTAGQHTFVVDEPETIGGTDLGATPVDAALGALAGCAGITLKAVAAYLVQVDVTDVEVRVECDFDNGGATLQREVDRPFQRVRVFYTLRSAATGAQQQELRDLVAKFCPVGKLFESAADVTHTWTIGDPG